MKRHCTGCVWSRDVGTRIVCMFNRCVRDNGWVGDRVDSKVVDGNHEPSNETVLSLLVL